MFRRKNTKKANALSQPPLSLSAQSSNTIPIPDDHDVDDTNTTLTNNTAQYLQSLDDPEIIERVRVTIKNAHVFKLPQPFLSASSIGYRGADWKDKVWQGNVKVVERGDLTAVLLVDSSKDTIFAVCPYNHLCHDAQQNYNTTVSRCIDSSRYFVLRVQNENGRTVSIGVAFNERTDAFDFNTALEDSRKERTKEKEIQEQIQERQLQESWGVDMDSTEHTTTYNSSLHHETDYSLKKGETIRVAIPSSNKYMMKQSQQQSSDTTTTSTHNSTHNSTTTTRSNKVGFLKPSSKDTPSRSKRSRSLNA